MPGYIRDPTKTTSRSFLRACLRSLLHLHFAFTGVEPPLPLPPCLPIRCRANVAHIRRSMPDFDLGLRHVQCKSLQIDCSCSLPVFHRSASPLEYAKSYSHTLQECHSHNLSNSQSSGFNVIPMRDRPGLGGLRPHTPFRSKRNRVPTPFRHAIHIPTCWNTDLSSKVKLSPSN